MLRRVVASALLLGVAACCNRSTYDAALRERDGLRASRVVDADPDGPPASACGDVPVVSYDDMMRGTHEGERVAVDGRPTSAASLVCTQRLCTDTCGRELPCCNACSGPMGLRVDGGRAGVELTGAGIGCGGPDCAVSCRPFGTRPARSYRFVGRYRSGKNPNGYTWVTFAAETWCHVPAGSEASASRAAGR